MKAIVKLYKDDAIKDDLNGEYEYLSSGAMGCAYRGNFGLESRCVIKFNRIPKQVKYQRENFFDSVREAIMGNFVRDGNLPESAARHWSQILGFGTVKGAIDLLEEKNGKNADRCNADLKDPSKTHVIMAFKSSGAVDLGAWLRFKQKLNAEEIRSIMFQLLWASYWPWVRYALVHADLKPDNIVLTVLDPPKTLRYNVGGHEFVIQNATISVALIDLGGAWIRFSDGEIPAICAGEKTFAKDPDVTSKYFTPIYEKNRNELVGNSQDLWALGMIMYCLAMEGERTQSSDPYHYEGDGRRPPDAIAVDETVKPHQALEYARMYVRIGLEKKLPANYLEAINKETLTSGMYVQTLLQKLGTEGLLLLYDLLEWDSLKRSRMGASFAGDDQFMYGLFHPFFVPYYAGRTLNESFPRRADAKKDIAPIIAKYQICPPPMKEQIQGAMVDVTEDEIISRVKSVLVGDIQILRDAFAFLLQNDVIFHHQPELQNLLRFTLNGELVATELPEDMPLVIIRVVIVALLLGLLQIQTTKLFSGLSDYVNNQDEKDEWGSNFLRQVEEKIFAKKGQIINV